MIFKLYFGLIYMGWFATTVLLGSYMTNHADASHYDLSIFFTITPISIFLRPIISAYADRKQAHKRLLVGYIIGTALSYIPFVLWPFFKPRYLAYMSEMMSDSGFASINWPFWILSFLHLCGSICYCGVRALGDATAVNFAKRVGDDFTSYRVYGSYTYGLAAYTMGFFNENNRFFPDFVPALLLHCCCCLSTALLVWVWPDEFFRISSEHEEPQKGQLTTTSKLQELPDSAEIWSRICAKLCCCCHSSSETIPDTKANIDDVENASNENKQSKRALKRTTERSLSTGQQFEIFKLLIKRDFRIPLYLVFILYTGFTAYAALNFVFTYLDEVCRTRSSCSGAEISALMMIGYCITEAIAYKLVDKLRTKLTRTIMLEVIFVSVAIHFYFYGFVLDKVSPYWFLVESLHGLEYAFSLALCIDLGYQFAREVDLIIPELIERGTVERNDHEQQELVRVSLMATMSSLFTLVYDGASCTFGAMVFGQIAGNYSFQTVWITIGTLAVIGSIILILALIVARTFNLRPQIVDLQQDKNLAMMLTSDKLSVASVPSIGRHC